MKYIICSLLLLSFLFPFGQKSVIPEVIEAQKNSTEGIEGVYLLVSRTTVIVEPKPYKTEVKISTPEWKGIYIFKEGHFSQTIMKEGREYSKFPPYYDDLAYESFAGEYVLTGNKLELSNTISLNQYLIGSSSQIEFKTNGKDLILFETLLPHRESRIKGTITTILQKIEK